MRATAKSRTRVKASRTDPREWEKLRARVAELEKVEAARKQAEAELLEANMRLSQALTELKRRQQQLIQQARLNALGQMTSGIAHDFNNALMPIQGFSEYLLNNPKALENTAEVRTILKDIHDAAKHAADLVRRLSNFYRPTNESECAFVSIADVIESAILLTGPRWKDELAARGVSIEFRRDIEPVPPIVCNEAQIREMMVNLILNAIDAMPQGGVMTFRVRQEEKWLVLEVSDTGVGMSPEVMERCFEPFFTTKGERGTGIGLSMVYGIVRGHGGHITVTSEENRGTTFTVHLPLDTPFPSKTKTRPETGTPPRSLRVLIIDDEVWSRNLMTRFLQEANHTVTVASTGAEGFRLFREGKFDLVVTDRAMPDMSGDTLAEQMKQVAPHIPIIMVTGFGEIMRAAGECPRGVEEVLGKPITRNELAVAMAKVVR